MMIFILVFSTAYMLGSVPFGLLLVRRYHGYDIRTGGSHNIGATNVLRLTGAKLAVVTLLLDGGKGALAVGLAMVTARLGYIYDIMVPVVALGAVVGHIFPIWLKGKGGKGVATASGALLALNSVVGLATVGVWLVVFALTRISSVASLTAALSAPFLGWGLGLGNDMIVAMASISTIIFWSHRVNIVRLWRGEEKPVGS